MTLVWIYFVGTILVFINKSSEINNHKVIFFKLFYGYAALMSISMIIGFFNILHTYYVILLFAVILLISIYFSIAKNLIKFSIYRYEILIYIALLLLIVVYCGRDPGVWDDTSYHLPYSKHYIENHGISAKESLRYPYFPQNMNILMAIGMMFGGVKGAQLLANIPIFILSVGMIEVSKIIFKDCFIGIFSIACLFLLEPVKNYLGYALVDFGLALFCFGLLSIMMLGGKKDIVAAGILAGLCAGIKPQGLLWGGINGLILFIKSKSAYRFFIFLLIFIVVALPWYTRSYMATGDPIHPLLSKYFGYYLWSESDLLRHNSFLDTYGAKKNILNIFNSILIAKCGIFLLAVFPIWLIKSDLKFIYIVFIIYILIWFYTGQVDRYLAPIYGIGSIISAYFLCSIFKPFIIKKYLTLLTYTLTLFIIIFYIFSANFQAKEDIYGYQIISKANSLNEKKILQLGFENLIFFYEGEAIGDWFGNYRYENFAKYDNDKYSLIDASQIKSKMQEIDVKVILVNGKKFQYDIEEYKKLFQITKIDESSILILIPNH